MHCGKAATHTAFPVAPMNSASHTASSDQRGHRCSPRLSAAAVIRQHIRETLIIALKEQPLTVVDDESVSTALANQSDVAIPETPYKASFGVSESRTAKIARTKREVR